MNCFWALDGVGASVPCPFMQMLLQIMSQKMPQIHTAGLPISYTVGQVCNFCCRGPILIPRPDSETSAQTTRVNVLVFL